MKTSESSTLKASDPSLIALLAATTLVAVVWIARPANAQVGYPFDLPADITATLHVDTTHKRSVNHMLLGLNCNWPNASHRLIAYDKTSGTHARTGFGAAYEIIRDVFENAELYRSRVESTTVGNRFDAISAEAIVKNGKLTVFAINKTPRHVPLHLIVNDTACTVPLVHQAVSFNDVNETKAYGLSENVLAVVAPGDEAENGTFVLPPLSLNRFDGSGG